MANRFFVILSCQVLNSDAIFKLLFGNCVLPDMIVTCDERDHNSNKYIEYPSIVFEALSPGNESIDRGQNLQTIAIVLRFKNMSWLIPKNRSLNFSGAKNRSSGRIICLNWMISLLLQAFT